jgi:hypothetical protein
MSKTSLKTNIHLNRNNYLNQRDIQHTTQQIEMYQDHQKRKKDNIGNDNTNKNRLG